MLPIADQDTPASRAEATASTMRRSLAARSVTASRMACSRRYSRAAIVANPLTCEEQAVVRRARAGDLSGLRAR